MSSANVKIARGGVLPESRYSINETMQLLGYQTIEIPGTRPLLEDLQEAYPHSFYENYMLVADALHLGMIIGKRAERARRKAGANV